jgi:hypothetical protein
MHGLFSCDILDMIQIDGDDGICARDLWKAIQDLFTNNKGDHSIVILNEFHSFVMGVIAYCKEKKCLANAFLDADSIIDDCVLILNSIRGLSPRMSHAASTITMSSTLPSFLKVHSM